MATIKFLYTNRFKPKLFTLAFVKTWAKRVLLLPNLCSVNFRWYRLSWAGAHLDVTSEIGLVKINGDNSKLSIGAYSTIGRVEIALHDNVIIGNNVCINDGVILLTASHDINDREWKHKKGKIIIEDYAWIASNAIVLPNVIIGKGAIIGAGAVVSKSVPPFSIVVGNPMKILEKKRNDDLCYNPCEFLALNNAWING